MARSATRIVIVGGGILGTMHARSALDRGYEVVQLDREQAARGASVRNFGLVWVSGRAVGGDLALAQHGRREWEKVGTAVPGTGFRPAGSLTVVTDDSELAVLRAALARPDAAERGFTLLDADQARSLNPGLGGEILAALHCERDAIVEPRRAVGAVRDWLLTRPGYRWLPGREAVSLHSRGVLDQTGERHDADAVFLCTGAAHSGLAGGHLTQAPVHRVRLQMMQTAPLPTTLTTAVADADSLRYYPGFSVPELEAMTPQEPVAAAEHSQLLLVQRLDGSLTIGDTHEYGEPFGFDVREDVYDMLAAKAERVLGAPLPRIERRWAGVYSQVAPGSAELYHRAEVADGVTVVTGPGGRGMTCSPAIAEESLIALEAGVSAGVSVGISAETSAGIEAGAR